MRLIIKDYRKIKDGFSIIEKKVQSQKQPFSQVINPSEWIFQRNLVHRVYHTFADRESGPMLYIVWGE